MKCTRLTPVLFRTGKPGDEARGRENEAKALKAYETKLNCERRSSSKVVTLKCGFIIHRNIGWLGATPDALVYDPDATQKVGLAEIKCTYTARHNMTIEEATVIFCLTKEGKKLRPHHPYYTQIQTQMAVTNKTWCDFIVYTTKGIHTQRIYFDAAFWKDTFIKFSQFYETHILPTL